IPDIGEKQFTVIAKNILGAEGTPKSGTITTKRSPLPVAEVAALDVNIVSPGKGYAGDSFEFKVKTTAPSEVVNIEIEGQTFDMQGSATEWKYIAKIDKVGISKYNVIAKNKDGVQGQPQEGAIKTSKKPTRPVNVLALEVSPKKGVRDKKFTFQARTDRPAAGVLLVVGEKKFDMLGSGTEWSLSKNLDATGSVNFSVVAMNADGVEGGPKTDKVTVFKERFKKNADGTLTDLFSGQVKKRFVDNGDGTITDLVTSLMWMQQPKQISLNWDTAIDYCRNLDYEGHTGWRLPTIQEFAQLRDKAQKNPALPPDNPFNNILTHVGYWSKSKHKFGPKYVYQISMWSGKTSHLKKDENAIVWPVRYTELPQ
ncbi:DUF1566 domain-containing protein, partial [Thermodesulfobacteriota bacterium]